MSIKTQEGNRQIPYKNLQLDADKVENVMSIELIHLIRGKGDYGQRQQKLVDSAKYDTWGYNFAIAEGDMVTAQIEATFALGKMRALRYARKHYWAGKYQRKPLKSRSVEACEKNLDYCMERYKRQCAKAKK